MSVVLRSVKSTSETDISELRPEVSVGQFLSFGASNTEFEQVFDTPPPGRISDDGVSITFFVKAGFTRRSLQMGTSDRVVRPKALQDYPREF